MIVAEPLLEVRDLGVTFATRSRPIHAVNGVSFDVRPGERIGIVGESGSGKSVTALAIMGLLRCPPAQVAGHVLFRGTDLVALPPRDRRRFRGAHLGMIFQNPLSSLNPAMKVGDQIVEAIQAHENVSRRAANRRAVELLGRVGIHAPARSVDEYPHRFSGGMRQRVMIAMALSASPELLIADEPTTALDVTTQAQIVELLLELSEERGAAVVLITHDLALLAGFAERLVVMYSGRVVEEGDVRTLYYGATHPYTWGLMTSITRLDRARPERLEAIAGNPPSATFLPGGCVFHPRCPYSEAVCAETVPEHVVHVGDDHPSACHFAGRLPPPSTLRSGTG